MKVLWLCNIILPQIAKHANKEIIPIGGWLDGLSTDLLKQDNLELTVLFPHKDEMNGSIGNLNYWSFQKHREIKFKTIIETEKPDIIHIFGTEFKHTIAMVNVCKEFNLLDKTVINIQGLVHYIGKYHYFASLPNRVINRNTIMSFFCINSIKDRRRYNLLRGEREISALSQVKHVIGRTDWDKACTTQINPNVNYHFCNETLRSSFYENKWDINKCEKYSIFLSQGHYPLKGVHYMLEALPIVLKKYPKAHVYITGKNPFNQKCFGLFNKDTYPNYIKELIIKNNIKNNITFLGSLEEAEMCKQYLNANVFVSPSSIENSSNSVCEGMILGTPTVSSDVGGIKNLLVHEKEGYIYQHDAPYMLAYYICKIFENDELAIEFSENSRKHALKTHCRESNLKRVLEIYDAILS